ncbi:ABC transporter permease [Reichenbachiella sp.]|uniref:ABC transporter permease n=1 Tax=Reichenbachiella sp. TaxID=2184521 RepID=UPI003298C12D
MSSSKKHQAPRLAKWLAHKLIKETYIEELFGDLQEMFEDRISTKGKSYALLMYWLDTFLLLIGFSSIGLFKTQNNNTIMIKNMFKIAWRNAIRQRQFTVLNLLGLSIGMATCLLIGLYVYDEMSYDQFHAKGDRIYRINQPDIWGNWDKESASTGPNVALALKEDIPDFEELTRIRSLRGLVMKYEEEGRRTISFEEDLNFAVDENFFDVFSFNFIQGSPETALIEPKSMVMTVETAERYFGYEDPIGKSIDVKHYDGTWHPYMVSGVLDNVPDRSHIQFDMLVPMNSHRKQMESDDWKWIWTAFSTYGLVQEGTDIEALTKKIQAVPPKWAPPTTERIFNQTFDEFTAGNPWTLFLQPLEGIYFSERPPFHRFGPTGNPQVVGIFGVIGILILLLSVINFMNLSTARSANRSKEVGIRKVLGSGKKSLVIQFIFESVLYVVISTIFALGLIELLLPWFNTFTNKNLVLLTFLMQPAIILFVLSFIVLVGVLAGSYPALYLSSAKPIETLKGKLSSGFKSKGIRNGLVVLQFTISISLIICAYFVQKQISYSSKLDVGYVKDNILQIHNIEQIGFDSEVLKTKLESNPAFTHVGKSFGVPPNIWSGDRYKTDDPESEVVYISNVRTDEDYINLLGLEFIAGRNFDLHRSNDKYGIILNEEAVKMLGWKSKDKSPIGKKLLIASGDEDDFEVIGVVKDFNFRSVKRKIEPLMIIHHLNDRVWDYGSGISFLSMRLNPEGVSNSEDLQRVIEEVKSAISDIDSSIPFEYSFMDQDFESTFRTEQRMGVVMNFFTAMAMVIACLGLFGLAAFSAEQRIKELGIRKVLGAKAYQLVFLFTSEFTKLIAVSVLIASPLAYYFTDLWLEDFAYKAPIEIWVFVVAAIGAMSLAIATIAYQSLRAAHRNPVDTLKDE